MSIFSKPLLPAGIAGVGFATSYWAGRAVDRYDTLEPDTANVLGGIWLTGALGLMMLVWWLADKAALEAYKRGLHNLYYGEEP